MVSPCHEPRESGVRMCVTGIDVDRHNDASGNGDGKPAVVIDRPLIAAALEEFRVELKARVGFHAMTATKGETNVRNPR